MTRMVWYDHALGQIVNQSTTAADALSGSAPAVTAPLRYPASIRPPSMRKDGCGFGPRLPLLVVSPWAKRNYVDHTLTDQHPFCVSSKTIGSRANGSAPAHIDTITNPINHMFNFEFPENSQRVVLDPSTGLV